MRVFLFMAEGKAPHATLLPYFLCSVVFGSNFTSGGYIFPLYKYIYITLSLFHFLSSVCERSIDVKTFWDETAGTPVVYSAEISCFHYRFCRSIIVDDRRKVQIAKLLELRVRRRYRRSTAACSGSSRLDNLGRSFAGTNLDVAFRVDGEDPVVGYPNCPVRNLVRVSIA